MAGTIHPTAQLAGRLLESLACPSCRGTLDLRPDELVCEACSRRYAIERDTPRLVPQELAIREDTAFYDDEAGARHGRDATTIVDSLRIPVEHFVRELDRDAVVLEIGSGRGAFDGIHPGYVALDLAFPALVTCSSPPRIQGHAEALPFRDGSVDAVFTVASLEHVPRPELALAEIARVLRPGGRALVYPAWYVRPWAARALHKRPAGELGGLDRLRKATIPVRDRREWQFGTRVPARLVREARLARGGTVPFRYRRLDPNLDDYVTSDADAFTSMDPHAASAFFLSRGFRDLNRPSAKQRLLYAYEPVVVQKAGDS